MPLQFLPDPALGSEGGRPDARDRFRTKRTSAPPSAPNVEQTCPIANRHVRTYNHDLLSRAPTTLQSNTTDLSFHTVTSKHKTASDPRIEAWGTDTPPCAAELRTSWRPLSPASEGSPLPPEHISILSTIMYLTYSTASHEAKTKGHTNRSDQ